MIQRIQSLFLLAAGGLLLSLFKLPLAKSEKAFGEIYANNTLDLNDHIGLLVLTVLGGLLAIGTIFLFNNRKLQSTLSYTVALLSIVLFGLGYWLYSSTEGGEASISAGLFMPLAALVLANLASVFIKKDDNLVKSMDRLR